MRLLIVAVTAATFEARTSHSIFDARDILPHFFLFERYAERHVEDRIATNLAKEPEIYERIMPQQPRKKKGVEEPKIGKEFKRIAEKNLRRDQELLGRLARILALLLRLRS